MGITRSKPVTISSCTAEYVAVTEATKEILYVRHLLDFLDYEYCQTVKLLCDNVGAVFLTKNYDGKRTKYLETQYHFVREYVENKKVSVKFTRTAENYSDPFTKNVSTDVYKRLFDYLW